MFSILEARQILEEVDEARNGNVFKNIYNIYKGRSRTTLNTFLSRVYHSLDTTVLDYVRTIPEFEPYEAIYKNGQLLIKHRSRVQSDIAKIKHVAEHKIDLVTRTYYLNDETIPLKQPEYRQPFKDKSTLDRLYKYATQIDKIGLKERINIAYITKEVSFLVKNREYIDQYLHEIIEYNDYEKERYKRKVKKFAELRKWALENQEILNRDLEKLKRYLNKEGFKSHV